jgi:hypothetical protein
VVRNLAQKKAGLFDSPRAFLPHFEAWQCREPKVALTKILVDAVGQAVNFLNFTASSVWSLVGSHRAERERFKPCDFTCSKEVRVA